MKPEANSRRLFGITRAKGKMYEFGLPEQSHIAIPQDQTPEELLLLTVGTLGDAAASVSSVIQNVEQEELKKGLRFSASYFDALFSSKLTPQIRKILPMLASVAYLLEGRPGSSLVMARFLNEYDEEPPLARLLRWLLQADWSKYYVEFSGQYGDLPSALSERVAYHFYGYIRVSEQAKLPLNNQYQHIMLLCSVQKS